MRSSIVAGVVAGLGLAVASVNAIPTIHVKGSKFFTSEGNQFFIKGIAYQLVPDDPLIDGNQCALDASLMKQLGANSIRVYHVDPNGDHSSCMRTFGDAGIYLWVDLDTFNTQIEQLQAFEKVMDEFQKYNNTAGFFVGNEVLTTSNGSVAAPYVKAAARDVKAYRNSKNYRNIPVGYSAADIASLRPMLQNYLACGSNSSEALDFFSLNAYEWCGDSTYTLSGYSQLNKNVTDYSIPIFFSETGCNTVAPRTFSDQSAIFGPEMSPYWSGSIIYEWIEEANSYGLIAYGARVDAAAPSAPPDGFPRSGTPTPVSPDFANLQRQWRTLSPSGVREAQYSPALTAPPCPALTPGAWDVAGTASLPTLGQTFVAAAASGTASGAATAASRSAGATASGAAASASASASQKGAAAAVGGQGWWRVEGVLGALVAVCVGVVGFL